MSNRLRVKTLASIVGLSVVFCFITGAPKAAAFNPSNLIDDSIFTNSTSMNSGQVRDFLNGFANSCISANNGFVTPDPQGWSTTSQAYTFGGNVSANDAITHAATHYSVNPQTLLATMQKEQSLFTGSAGCYNSPNASATVQTSSRCTAGTDTSSLCTKGCTFAGGCLNIALGYGCPYYCYVSSEGFSNQLIRAAWTFRFSQERAYGNLSGYSGFDSGDNQLTYSGPMTAGYRQRSSSDSSNYYDGTYTTSDGTSLTISNGATSALYNYTPFISGNKSFDTIFQTYFGGIYAAPYATSLYAEGGFPSLNPGQSTTTYLEYQNQGSYAWYDDSSISTAAPGTNVVHLATSHPFSRSSGFYDSSWANSNRPAVNFSAVYQSDGTTLASNQHIALPGQIVKYSFKLDAPNTLAAGTYQEFFQPVAEGTSDGAFNDPGTYLNIAVNPAPALNFKAQSAYPTIAPGMTQQSSVSFTNSGNIPLYDSASISGAPANSYPLHLATSCPLNTTSDFSSDWPTPNRPDLNFSAVYQSDGTTLASNQDVVQPGQIVKFNFNFSIPNGYSAGTYKSCFQPILEGTSGGYFPDMGVYLNVTVPSTGVARLTGYPGNVSAVSGETTSLAMTITNVGNATIPTGTTLNTNDGGSFQDSSWTNSNALATINQSIAPNGTVSTGTLTLLTPIETVQTILPTHYTLALPSSSSSTLASDSATVITNISPVEYTATFVGQSTYPTFSYGQSASLNFSYKNEGNVAWRDDSGMSGQDTRNTNPVHLATASPLNRTSGFSTGSWFNGSRPAVNFSAVYQSDGTTLASNQHVALPGQIVKFNFNASPQGWVQPGTYREYFQPIAEGTSDGAFNNVGSYLDFTVPTLTYQATFVSQSAYPNFSNGQSASAFFQFKNSGSATWYDDASVPNGMDPVHLAATNPINRRSIFSSTWPSAGRPNVTFSKVFNSDDMTLASNQHTVLPGQIMEFDFTLSSQNAVNPGTYREYFQPVLEGAQNAAMGSITWLDVTIH